MSNLELVGAPMWRGQGTAVPARERAEQGRSGLAGTQLLALTCVPAGAGRTNGTHTAADVRPSYVVNGGTGKGGFVADIPSQILGRAVV